MRTNEIQMITYDPQFLPAFVALNRQWIETHFELEPMDLAQLENPQKYILDKGGEIFFLIEKGEAVATFAMIPHGPQCYELAKMAVKPGKRGLGYGSRLMNEATRWAKAHGAKKIMLLSNTILTPAISLYFKHGFKTVSQGTHPDYKRCNIEMELKL